MSKIPLGLYRLALLVQVLMMGYLGTTASALPTAVDVSDKLLHGLAFFVLMWLADCSWPGSVLRSGWWLKLLLVFGYGLLIEIVQYSLPFREFSLADMLANGVGMALYLLMALCWRRLPWRGSGRH